jgi:tetratricopeptide (TPR) repeat protein
MVQMNSMLKPPYRALTSIALFSSLALLALPSNLILAEPAGKTAPFAAADQAFMAMKYEKADSLYETISRSGPENADLLWKLSRLNISVAESFSPREATRRMPYYTKAVEYARKAVSIDSTNAAAHTWLAASLAVKADRIGTKEKLARAKEIKRELDKALALNPHDDVAWSILGSYYRQVSNIGWMSRLLGNTFVGRMPEGSPEAAEKAFKKAISLNPRAIRHYHELALLYIDQHRDQEALQTLQIAVRKPALMKSDLRRLDDIRELIKKLSEVQENRLGEG